MSIVQKRVSLVSHTKSQQQHFHVIFLRCVQSETIFGVAIVQDL